MDLNLSAPAANLQGYTIHLPLPFMRTYRLRSIIFCLALLLCNAVEAQEGLTPYHVTMVQTVGEVATSPDGDYVAYTVATPANPLEENASSETSLRLYDVDDKEDRELLPVGANTRALAWVPGEEQLSFLAAGEDNGPTALYVMDLDSGAMHVAATFETGIRSYVWDGDGERIAFVASEPRSERGGPDVPYRPRVYEEETAQQPVFTVTAYSGKAPTPLGIEGTVYGLAWGGGGRLAVAVAPDPYVDSRYVRQAIRLYDVDDRSWERTVEHEGKMGVMKWSPDGNYLAFIGSSDLNDPKEGRLYVASAGGGTPRDLMPGLEGHVSAIDWLDDKTIGYVVGMGVETMYGSIEADGNGRKTIVPSGMMIMETVSAGAEGEVVAFAGDSPMHPRELFVWTDDDTQPMRITNLNPWLDSVTFARQEVISYEARDGLEIEGLLIHPLNSEGPAPLITVVHGGPESHYTNGWVTAYSLPGQVAAARGYAVFYPNYRGSTGRGVAFSKTSQGEPAGAEFDDIIDGIDALIARGVADADRVGVTGGSYGGYATGWLSTRYSDRIAAGVMFVGISNKISKVGTTDIPEEEYLVHARKRPWDDWQFFLERSPIFWAGQSQTPLLIMHGEDDPRVDPGQSMELYRHLKMRGQAPVRLVLYPGEGTRQSPRDGTLRLQPAHAPLVRSLSQRPRRSTSAGRCRLRVSCRL